jgi:hypothetical protein
MTTGDRGSGTRVGTFVRDKVRHVRIPGNGYAHDRWIPVVWRTQTSSWVSSSILPKAAIGAEHPEIA